MQRTHVVYPSGDEWFVRDKGGFALPQVFQTKQEALGFARCFASDLDTEIIIHDDYGHVQSVESYACNHFRHGIAG